MLSGVETLFPLTSEQKTEHSHGFPSLPGCEALIDLGVAELEVVVSFASCPKPLCSVHRCGCSACHPAIPIAVCLVHAAKKQGHSGAKLLLLQGF